MKKLLSTTLIIVLFAIHTFGQNAAREDSESFHKEKQEIGRRHSLGSSLFLLGNIGDSVNFFQLNYGYQLTPKSIFIAEAITWTYYEPLGTYGSSEKFYPGKVQAFGIGVGYQRPDIPADKTNSDFPKFKTSGNEKSYSHPIGACPIHHTVILSKFRSI